MKSAAAALCLAVSFAAVADDDVPFVTTPDAVTMAMLELAAVTARDHIVDLGSGDGRIVITAARRFGASGLGVEIVPDLVRASRANARAAGVHERAEFREQDLFATDLAAATVVTMYLLPQVNLQLRPRLLALAPGTRIVSHDWDLGDWTPDRSVRVDVPDKALGRDKFSRVHLWIVPARVHGAWCADGASLEIAQRFQRFSATLTTAGSAAPAVVFDGRVEASTLRGEGPHAATLRLDGATLRLAGNAAGAPARSFLRARAASCP
ncbi:MAG: class I SAM-dependent methyltransferase [Caldimonas sp.]